MCQIISLFWIKEMVELDIKIEKKGIIIQGDSKGWSLYIQDDTINTGGYLILVTPPQGVFGRDGYDNWVENSESLKAYFQEANWKIRWL